MTVLYLCLAFVLITGTIPVQFAHDTGRGTAAREIARLCAPLPPVRALDPDDWPKPLSPLDLPGVGDTQALAAVALLPRVFVAAPAPIVVGLAAGGGRHHIGVAAGTEKQRALWNSPTGQFLMLVGAGWSEEEQQSLSREWWCESCVDDHRDCVGACACPCTLVEVAV